MGVVKDGAATGFLPSKQVFAIHYPGYPSSMSRAIETLGGTEAIRKARTSQSSRLELHFRPEDPYAHPAFGDLRPCNNFLLKISKTKSSAGQSDQVSDRTFKRSLQDATDLGKGIQSSEPESELLARKEDELRKPDNDQLNFDIVARVPEAYHFDGMVDYQHVIAVHADVARKKKRNWTEIEEPHFDKGGLMDVDQEDVMILLPQLFAPKDVPDSLVLKPPATLSAKKNQEEPVQHQWEMSMEPVLALDFGISEIPKRTNWEEYISHGSDQWVSQMALSRLFDERPIWPKESLTERLLDKGFNFSDHILRRLLSRVAYYFSRGPFLRFWIKKGYDPRKDPDSRIYQKIDYRVRPPLQSYCDANSANQLKHRWEDICAFRVFPYKCHTTLQLFELGDDYIQEQIRKPPAQTTCSSETGWFSYNMLENLKDRVKVRFLSVFPEPGSEHLLKAATESFKKSKKMCSKDNFIRAEVIQPEDNAGKEDAAEPNNLEDDEKDDTEADNVEEALDTYDGIDAAEDGEISLQSHSYMNMENISRTHLQELFGSFPSSEAGGDGIQQDVAATHTSDEEYQIYEQESDGNFSDEAIQILDFSKASIILCFSRG
ncbi:general transcription factor 3C polypeptide 5 isoform X2 [Pyrus x bretschneideri]|uniref:general transcription factor 3C polypeptide 5 isoform X2 n=1 Tax=Pyrus x bretschneideri TaxID=225117 RepID=UPI00202EECC8|nr:general transcription factor 3C polypeptide 5 isoform X2 [Pyrus x bretschneideri]